MKLNSIVRSVVVMACSMWAANAAYECFDPALVGKTCEDGTLFCISDSSKNGAKKAKEARSLSDTINAEIEELKSLKAELEKISLKSVKNSCLKAIKKEEKKKAAAVKKLTKLARSVSKSDGICLNMDYCMAGTLLKTQDESAYLNYMCYRGQVAGELSCLTYDVPPIGEKSTRSTVKCTDYTFIA